MIRAENCLQNRNCFFERNHNKTYTNETVAYFSVEESNRKMKGIRIMRKLISMILSIIMLFSMVPTYVLAEEAEGEEPAAVVEQIMEPAQEEAAPVEGIVALLEQEEPVVKETPEEEEESEPVETGEEAIPSEEEPSEESEGEDSGEAALLEEETVQSCGDNVYWQQNGGVLTISGNGAMADYSAGGAPWYAVKETVICVIIANGVTGIGQNAFYGCSSLNSITLAASVTGIGTGAFDGCSIQAITYGGTEARWNELGLGAQFGSSATMTFHTHTVVTDPAVESTCLENGKTEGSHCSECGEILVAQETVAASGTHTVVTDEAVAPTCTETGRTEGSHCSACGEVLVAQEEVEPTGHRFENYVEDHNATCTGNSTRTAVCENGCGVTDVLDGEDTSLGHTLVTDAAILPTCTEEGKTEGRHCSSCGEVLVAQEEIPATGHNSIRAIAVSATYTQEGYTEYYHCNVCGKDLTKKEVVPKLVMEAPVAKALNTSSVKLTWKKVPNVTGYYVYRCIANSSGEDSSVLVKGLPAKTVTFTDKGLQAGMVYEYRVVPYCPEYGMAQKGIPVSSGEVSVPLAKPVLNVKKSGETAHLSWKTVPGAEGYRVYINRGMGEELLEGLTITPNVKNAALLETSISITLLGSYEFRLEAYSAVGVVVTSAAKVVKGTLRTPSLSAKAAPNLHSVTVSWKPVPGAQSYILYYTDEDGVVTTRQYAKDAELYDEIAVAPTGSHAFVLYSVTEDENNTVCSVPAKKTLKISMKVPGITFYTYDVNTLQLTAKWPAGVDKVEIRYSDSKDGDFRSFTTEYPVKISLALGKTYYFQIRGVSQSNGKTVYTAWSKQMAKTLKCTAPTCVPYISNYQYGNQIGVLTNTENKKAYNNVEVYRSTSKNGPFECLGYASSLYNDTQWRYLDNDVTLGVTYFYKVRAVSSANGFKGYSAFSAVKSITIK